MELQLRLAEIRHGSIKSNLLANIIRACQCCKNICSSSVETRHALSLRAIMSHFKESLSNNSDKTMVKNVY